jgi:RNA polymerase sigma factor for flagellar operon FliA
MMDRHEPATAPTSPSQAALIKEYEHNARLAARAFVRRFRIRMMPLQDVEQAALEGLTKATQRFSLEHRVKFWSFARYLVHGAMVDEVRRCGELTRAQCAAISTHQFLDENAREACPSEAPSSVDERAAARHTTALALLHWLQGATIAYDTSKDAQPDPDAKGDPEATAVTRERARRVRAAIAQLSERHRRIIERHYYDEMQSAEIAVELGKNKSTISRQFADAHVALAALLSDPDLE